MGNQGYRSNYLAAFESANHQLEYIYSEYHELQRRREKLEGVVMALEQFLQSGRTPTEQFHPVDIARREPAPIPTEIYAVSQQIAEPVIQATTYVEPPAAPVYTPTAEELDPLQLRINRALGLAVA